jgi:membrane protein YqaA with SNARE-associated domain
MKMAKVTQKINQNIIKLQKYADSFWYPPVIGLLALIDNFIVVIPNDGILISSSMLRPKKWIVYSLFIAIGSTIGATLLASVVELRGLPWIIEYYPNFVQSKSWSWSQNFFSEYGLLFLFFVSITPLVQQPAVILASLANASLYKIALIVFVGRFIKFLIMSYIASHSPKYLKKLWGVEDELKDLKISN